MFDKFLTHVHNHRLVRRCIGNREIVDGVIDFVKNKILLCWLLRVRRCEATTEAL